MQVVMSNQSFNLNTKLSRNLYVKSNKNSMSNNNHMFDDSEFELMMGKPAPVAQATSNDEVEYEDESEDEQEDLDKKLDNLKFE
jgi:predicted lipid-binding transport protein (Tim44 family)